MSRARFTLIRKARGLSPAAFARLLLPKRIFGRRYEELQPLPAEASDDAALQLPGALGPLDAPAAVPPAAQGEGEDLSPRGPTAKPAAARAASSPPSFLRSERQLAHVGPGFLGPDGMTNGRVVADGQGLVNGNGIERPAGRVNGGRVNGGRVNGGRVNGGRVNGGRVNGGRTNGGRVNGGRVNGGRVNGGRVNGGRVNGGRVNGGRVNGGRVNGGRTNGGATNGSGFVNGRGLLYTDAVNYRRRRSTRRIAILLALLFVSMAVLGPFLYLGVFAPQPIVVDGDFSDWAGFPAYPDSAADQTANGNVNLVAFAAVESDREFYFYFQVPQGMHPFAGPQNPAGAESFRILLDSDRNASTGYFAFGLGVDFVVELSGYDGGLKSASLRVFAGPASQRTDAAFFQTSGAVRAIVSGNQIEGSVARGDIRLAGGRAAPFLLALSQDSRGAQDLGDEIYTTLPGALVLNQTPTAAGTIPTDRDVLLLTLSGRALHENVSLVSLGVLVDGVSGAGIEIAYALVGGRNETQNASALAGGTAVVTFQSQGPLGFNVFGAPQSIEIWGRATGPVSVGALRVYVAGASNISTAAVPAGFSGHGSVFPPFVFERSYVGAAASSIRIDGAFADWSAARPFDGDPDDDVRALSVVPTPNATNAPESIDQNVDLRFTKADVNSGDGQVSFYLEVDGSIMAGRLLPLPAYPRPPAVSQGGGGGTPGESAPDADIATLYLDVDANAVTGWAAAPGIGVDTVIQIFGSGGAYGRTAHTVRTTLAQWNTTTLRFAAADFDIPVGYGSSKLEAQVPADLLCPGPCPPVRYLYMLQSVLGDSDTTSVLTTNYRGQGQALLLDERSGLVNNAYQGDFDVPVLDISIASPPTNEFSAQVIGLTALITGVSSSDITGVAFSADLNGNGRLDADEASAPSLVGTLLSSGYADLFPTGNVSIAPGERFDGFLTVDISFAAHTPAFLNATVAGVGGLRSAGIPDVRYTSDPSPRALRILAYTPGGRGQNNLVINEVNLVQGFVEIFDTTGSSTSLTAPSRMGLQVYRTGNNGGGFNSEAILVFTGSTNSEGFATFNLSVPLSTATRKYFVAIWCANCTAGQDDRGRNNQTYVNVVQMPRLTSNGSWGRFPDGDFTMRNTTNNTRNDNNQITGTQNGTPPSSQNYLVINEVSFVGSWVEIVSILPVFTNLTAPSRMGIEIYSTNTAGGNFQSAAIRVFSGTTNAQGFAVINVTVPLSTATRRYHVALWCENCTAGQDYRGRDNQSYVDDVELPRSAALGAWGRYPDGDGSFLNTTNNTRGTDNQIPEFSDIVVPLGLVMAMAWVGRRRRASKPEEGLPSPIGN